MYKLVPFDQALHAEALLRLDLRPEDRREFEATSGVTGNQPVLQAAIASNECIVVYNNDEVVGVWGIVKEGDGVGIVWGCGSNKVPREILIDAAPQWLNEAHSRYDVLCGFIDSRNLKHIKWLKRMKFRFWENVSVYNGIPFHYFYRRKADV